MTTFVLKVVAMATMVCDHLGLVFLGNPLWMRCVGRCSFLCYAFLLAEAYRHLREKPERLRFHLGKLALLAAASEVQYDYTFTGSLDNPARQNVIITLLVALAMLALLDVFKGKRAWQVGTVVGLMALTYFVRSSYRISGLVLVLGFYWYLTHSEGMGLGGRIACLACVMLAYWPVFILVSAWSLDPQVVMEKFTSLMPWFYVHLAMCVPLALYEGEEGRKDPAFNAFYSWFYPAHLVVFALMRFLLTAH